MSNGLAVIWLLRWCFFVKNSGKTSVLFTLSYGYVFH